MSALDNFLYYHLMSPYRCGDVINEPCKCGRNQAAKELSELREQNKKSFDLLYRLYHAQPPSLELWQEVYRFLEGKP